MSNTDIWKNGEFVAFEDATVHVLTHAMHYGTSVFEGVRCYNTAKGSAIFRHAEHMQRLIDSARIYRMDLGYSQEELFWMAIQRIDGSITQEASSTTAHEP